MVAVDGRAPALTICIPSYNRGKRVHSLVLYLLRNLVPLTDDVEIIVVNNCSTDDTRSLIEPLVGGALSLYNRDVFLETAELNMFHSLELCRGDFVWYHGDDEIPVVESIIRLIADIRDGQRDLYIYNSPVINDEGVVLTRRMANMRTGYLDVSGDAMVETAGFAFMLAGISNVVFRREFASIDIAWEAQKVQPLYAHVCWLIACFSKRSVRIVNTPLVYYRNLESSKQVAHFKKFSEKVGLADHYFWGVGIALQLKWLVEHGHITAGCVPRIFEGRRDGSRFRLMAEVVHKIYTQVLSGVSSAEPRNKISEEVFSEIRDFMVSCDLFAYDVFEPIEKLHEISCGKRPKSEATGLKLEFERIFSSHEAEVFRNNWYGHRLGFEIYRMATVWVAVRPEVEGGVSAALSVIDIQEQPPLLLVDSQLDVLLDRVALQAREDVVKVARSNRSAQESRQLARESLELAKCVVHEYAQSVAIYRQFTLAVRKATWIVVYPLARVLRWGRRALRARRHV